MTPRASKVKVTVKLVGILEGGTALIEIYDSNVRRILLGGETMANLRPGEVISAWIDLDSERTEKLHDDVV